MAERTCSVDGCEGKHYARGWCQKHYLRWYKHGDPLRERPPRLKPCKVEGCDGVAGKPGTAKGYCSSHYQRWKRWGDPLGERPLRNKGRTCRIAGCDKPAHSMGWCVAHYSRYYRKGDPEHRLAGEVVGGCRICPVCDEDKPRNSEFWHAHNQQADGLALVCKECVCARRRERPYTPVPGWLEQCAECLCIFTANGLRSKCCSPECSDKNVARQNAVYRHRRRALMRDAFVEDVDPLIVMERDDWVCQLCADPIDPAREYPDPQSPSVDHIVPLAKGGEHSYANCQASHLGCNCAKGAKEVNSGRPDRAGAIGGGDLQLQAGGPGGR